MSAEVLDARVRGDRVIQLGQEVRDHAVILSQPPDQLAQPRMLSLERGEQRVVFAEVVRREREAESVAVQEEISGRGPAGTPAGDRRGCRLLRGVECPPQPAVRLAKLGIPRDQPVMFVVHRVPG